MRQEVNLYTLDFRRGDQPLSARMIVRAALGFLAALLLVEALAVWQLHNARDRLEALRQDEQTIAARLATLRASRSASGRAGLQASIETLQTEIRRREELQSLMAGQHLGNTQGFSIYLEAMARQASDDVSLTRIRLLNSGEYLELAGWTRRPEAVPFYLQKLRDESSFQTVKFGVLSINKDDENSRHLRFSLGKPKEGSL